MGLAYFHTNRLLIELYKQETEIRCRKDDGPIKKYTDIDHHDLVPYSISRQIPDPPHFSLPTTFNLFSSGSLFLQEENNFRHIATVSVPRRLYFPALQ